PVKLVLEMSREHKQFRTTLWMLRDGNYLRVRMKSSPKRFGFVLLAVLLTSSVLMAVDIPLTNWTVPPYHASGSQGGITTMTDVTPGTGFVGVAPCRLVDTRIATMPNFPAPYGPPSLAGGSPRNFDLNSDPQCPGL